MNLSKHSNNTQNGREKLKNFDLTVDEIRLMKSIEEKNKSVNNLLHMDPQSTRAKVIRMEIAKLEDKLEDLRDNTLIR